MSQITYKSKNTQDSTAGQLIALDDFLLELRLKLERACAMLCDLNEDYFAKDADNLTEADVFRLRLGYREYQTKACIAADYLRELEKVIEKETARCSNEISQRGKREAANT